ncbi:LuxR C-terminal-related transcriptional regulator [Enterobacter hormaechei subsp. steigerwaltii]
MPKILNVITNNNFYFYSLIEIFSANDVLANMYHIKKIGSRNIASWLKETQDDHAIVMAGPDTESLTKLICTQRGYNYISSRFKVKDMMQFFLKGYKPRKNSACLKATNSHISTQDIKVLIWVSSGLKPCDISKHYGISIKTISHHKRNLMKKLQIKSTMQLVDVASQYSLLCKQLNTSCAL